MKVPCVHLLYDAHDLDANGWSRCSGGETPTDDQLISELRKRGTLVYEDRGNTDRLVTRWSGYHQDRT